VGGGDLDRERQNLRRSFDTDAGSYERTRPVLPDALFDDLCEAAVLTRGSRVIEIGCGTGQATLPLARRGLNITALELGPQLAALARQKLADFPSVSVMTSSFEDWEATDSSIDAIIAVNSLLWIDPDVRFTKPARLLRRGGTMAVAECRWVAPEDVDPFLEAVEEDYRAVRYPGGPPPTADRIESWHFPPDAGVRFTEVLVRRYRFSLTLSAEDYVALLATQWTTTQLGPDLAGSFLGRVKDRLATMGVDAVTRPYIGLLTVGRVTIR
jgi:cyclopropane fatty-acyl-phospholipid synthase-like methyltransferase